MPSPGRCIAPGAELAAASPLRALSQRLARPALAQFGGARRLTGRLALRGDEAAPAAQARGRSPTRERQLSHYRQVLRIDTCVDNGQAA